MAQPKLDRKVAPTRGLYTSAASDLIGPEFSPWCQNVRFRFGSVIRAPGRSALLDTQGATILDFFRYTNAVGNVGLGTLEAGGAGTNYMAPYNSSTRTFGSEIALPYQWGGASGRFSWSGGEDRVFVARNSQVGAINYNGTSWSVETLSSPQGRFVEYFSNRVFLMNLYGAGMRVQWSKRAQYNDWTVGTGAGGWLDLFDGTEVEALTGGKILNDRLVVYRKSSIVDIVSTGDDVTPFLPQGRVYGIGCMAPFTLRSVGQFHIFLANDYNVYIWDGVKLTAIGSQIHNYIRQALDSTKIEWGDDAIFAATFMGYKEYWLVIPSSITGEGTVILIYDYQRDTWTRDVLPNLTALYEAFERGAVGTAGYSEVGYPTLFPVLFAGQGGNFFMIDERVDGDRLGRPADGGMEMFWDTPELYFHESTKLNGTIEGVMITQARTTTPTAPVYYVDVALHHGLDNESFPIAAADYHGSHEFVDCNLTSNVYRLRFRYPATSGASKPTIRGYTVTHVPSGEFFRPERLPTHLTRDLPPTGIE